ncbi:hypothetical protein ABI59_16550 [Acidobacteria bacterium Mor1]|nr:hypothetical protein ABI59_16550 [Acidobacteria bacterium Mor1]
MLPEDAFVSAQWLHLKPRGLKVVLFGLILISLLWVGIGTIYRWAQGEIPGSDVWPYGLFLGLLLAFLIWLPFKFRASYRQHKILQRPFELELSPTGLRKHDSDEEEIPWSQYVGYRKNDSVLLIYQTPALFQVLPRTLFETDAGFDHAVALVGRHLKRI